MAFGNTSAASGIVKPLAKFRPRLKALGAYVQFVCHLYVYQKSMYFCGAGLGLYVAYLIIINNKPSCNKYETILTRPMQSVRFGGGCFGFPLPNILFIVKTLQIDSSRTEMKCSNPNLINLRNLVQLPFANIQEYYTCAEVTRRNDVIDQVSDFGE